MDMVDVLGEVASEHEDFEMIDAPLEWEVIVLDEIDPYVVECELQTIPIKELESFLVDPRDPSRMLKVGTGLST